MATDNMRIKIRVDGAKKGAADITGLNRAIGNTTTMLLSGAAAYMAFKKAIDLTSQSLKISGQFEQWEIAFETMLGSAKLAKEMMEDLFEFAKKTPFQVPELVENTKKLMGMGIEADKVIDTMRILGDVAAGLGVPIERLALNFGQVKAQTQLTGRELRDFAMAGVPILSELAKMLNKSEAAIQDMISAGQIGFPEVEQAFINMSSEGGKFYNLMARQNEALLGQWSNLQDSATRVGDAIGDRLMPIAKKVVPAIITILGDMEQSIRDNTIAMNIHKTSIDLASEAYTGLSDAAKLAGLEERKQLLETAIMIEENPKVWTIAWRQAKQITSDFFTVVINDLSALGFKVTDNPLVQGAIVMALADASKAFASFETAKDNAIDTEGIANLKLELEKIGNELLALGNVEDGGKTPPIVIPVEVEMSEQAEMLFSKGRFDTSSMFDELEAPPFGEVLAEQMREAAEKLKQENEALAQEMINRWQQVGDIMSNTFYEAFDGQFDNIEEMFDNMLKRMLADLVASGLMMLLSSGTSGGVGFFGGGGLFSGLLGSSSPTNNITVNPAPVVINFDPVQVSRSAETGDIVRGL